jgi:hypothetical protein
MRQEITTFISKQKTSQQTLARKIASLRNFLDLTYVFWLQILPSSLRFLHWSVQKTPWRMDAVIACVMLGSTLILPSRISPQGPTIPI